MNQEQINEKLSASAPAKEWIDDFVKSDDARFEGKSKDERIMMALGAYYAAKNESVEALSEGEGKCKIAEETIELAEKIYYGDYECGSEKSQFGGYRPHVINKETGKTFYLGQASYKTPGEAKKHAESYLKQKWQGKGRPDVPIKGTYVKETLDPVGKEDDDIDNDGDEDESDEYLKNRRKTVTKAVQKEEVEDLEEAAMNSFPDFRSNLLSIYPSHSEEQVRAAWQKYKAEFLKKEEAEIDEASSDEQAKALMANYKAMSDKEDAIRERWRKVKQSNDRSTFPALTKELKKAEASTKYAYEKYKTYRNKHAMYDSVEDATDKKNEMPIAEARELKVAQLALKSDGSGKLEDFVKNYSVIGKSIIQIKEEYAKFLASQIEEADAHTMAIRKANKEDRTKRAAAMAKVFSNLDKKK